MVFIRRIKIVSRGQNPTARPGWNKKVGEYFTAL